MSEFNRNPPESTTRRQLLQGMAALSGFAVLGMAEGARARSTLDLANRDDLLATVIKMRGALDDRLVISYVIGTRYAVPEHDPLPMMGILAATFSRYRRIGADAFQARSLEVAFFTDLATGELLERWKNPVTGAMVTVPQTRMGPSTLRVTADGLTVDRPSGEASGLELKHRFMPPVAVGDQVWVTEEIRVNSGPPKAGTNPFVYTELSTYLARRADLENAALATVPTTVQYQSLITYRPWMGFGTTPGHTLAQGVGARVGQLDELPEPYLRLLREKQPDVARDPAALLA